jgi:hypothetical protein
MLRIPHCLDNWLIDGGKVARLTHPPHFTAQKHYYFNVFWYSFLLEADMYIVYAYSLIRLRDLNLLPLRIVINRPSFCLNKTYG